MTQEVYLIDRKNNYYRINGLNFPHHNPESYEARQSGGQRNHTLLDGELVVDRTGSGQTKLRLLLFDCVVLEHRCMADSPLTYRYGCLLEYIIPPYVERLGQSGAFAPFE